MKSFHSGAQWPQRLLHPARTRMKQDEQIFIANETGKKSYKAEQQQHPHPSCVSKLRKGAADP